jgi:hypothetical protein
MGRVFDGVTMSKITIDNLEFDVNTVSALNTDGNITLNPNGNGLVECNAPVEVYGTFETTSNATIGGTASIGGTATFTSTGGDCIQLKAGNTTDGHGFMSFWKNTASGATRWGYIGIEGPNSDYLTLRSNASQDMRITADGNLILRGTGYIELNQNGATKLLTNATGCEIVGTVTCSELFQTSDYRLKQNVNYDFSGLGIISQLKPCSYEWKEESNYVEEESDNKSNTVYGFLAHELDTVYPSAVSGKKDALKHQAIAQTKLIGILTKAIQELSAKNDALNSQMASVMARLSALESN